MIVIHIMPGGEWFSTIVRGNLLAVEQAHVSSGAQTSWYSNTSAPEFETFLSRYIHGGGYFVRAGGYIVGDWKQWGAFCIRKWGAWFHPVQEAKGAPDVSVMVSFRNDITDYAVRIGTMEQIDRMSPMEIGATCYRVDGLRVEKKRINTAARRHRNAPAFIAWLSQSCAAVERVQ